MGFWSRLFRKEISPEIVPRAELEVFCRKRFSQGFRSFVAKKVGSLHELENDLKEKCDTLEQAELKNPNIPPRALQIMEGNRAEFLRKSRLRFEDLRERLNAASSSSEVIQAGTDMTKLLEDLAASTRKPYAVLQEFFANETRAVTQVLSDLQDLATRLQRIREEDFCTFERVLELVGETERVVERRKAFEQQMEEQRKVMSDAQQDLEDATKERERLAKSEEFAEVMRLRKELAETEAGKKLVDRQVFEMLAPLSRALKKFTKVSMDVKTVDALAEDPLNVFSLDGDKVHAVLSSLLKNLEEGKIDVKAPEKSIAVLKGIDRAWLMRMKEERSGYDKKAEELQSMIAANPVEKRIAERKKEEEKLQDQIARIKSELRELDLRINESTTEKINEKIEQTLRDVNVVTETFTKSAS